jgi:hypothetical protein
VSVRERETYGGLDSMDSLCGFQISKYKGSHVYLAFLHILISKITHMISIKFGIGGLY